MTQLEKIGFQVICINPEFNVHLCHFDQWEQTEKILEEEMILETFVSEETQLDIIITKRTNPLNYYP